MSARNVVVDGDVYSLVPAEQAAEVARIVERAFDRMPVGWQPTDTLANTVSVLRCAPLVVVSETGQFSEADCDDVLVTPSEAESRFGVRERTVRRLAAAGTFPGARRTESGRYLIPVSDLETYTEGQDAA